MGNRKEIDRSPEAALADAVNTLKWHLIGLQLMGIRDWPRTPRRDDEVPFPGEDPFPCTRGETARGPGDAAPALEHIREDLAECTRCRLHTSRMNIVYGDGSPRARLVFVGEGPGSDEDRQGVPFVGRAGKLLDNMIRALHLQRAEVYICNVVKCRPPNNRTPQPDEIQTCSPFLFRQLEALRPLVICALGACAAQTLLATTKPISGLRGKRLMWRDTPLVCTFHPAYLLRNPSQKASSWQDLLVVQGILQEQKERNCHEQ